MSKSNAPVWLGLTRNVILLGVVSLLTDMAGDMIFPLLPIFLARELGQGPAVLGVISGTADCVASLLRLFSGWLSDRIGRRKILILIGYGIASLARPFMGLATAWWHVLAVRVVDRTGKGIRLAPRDALLADSCDEAVRGRAFGFQQMADNFGAATGPLIALGLIVACAADLRTVFLFSAVPGALVLLAILFGVVEKPPRRVDGAAVRLTLRPFGAPFKIYLAATFLLHLAVVSEFFLVQRMLVEEFTVVQTLLTWSGFMAVRSLSAWPGGLLSDRLGRRAMIAVGWLLFAGAWGAMAFAPRGWVLLPLAAYGAFIGFAEGPQRAFVADLVPEHLRGTAFGVYAFAVGVATLPANLVFGLVWQKAGMTWAFLGGAVVAACALALLAFVRARPSDPSPAA